MELCELGDLKTILFGEGPFTEVSCRYIVKDLSDAIVYLHKHGRILYVLVCELVVFKKIKSFLYSR